MAHSEPRVQAPPTPPNSPALSIDVVELNAYAPRPFAFTETALCLCDSIRAMGLGSNHLVNIANPRGVSIVLGALPPLLGPLEQLDPRKTMIFNLEQLASTSALVDAQYIQWLRKWLVLDYHGLNVECLRRVNGAAQRALELPIVPSRSVVFETSLPADKTVDVLFFGSLNERRTELLRRLEQAGLRVETVAGAYADELAPAIKRARLVLHIHFYDTGLFPIARILQPVAGGVPVVCETSVFSARSDWSRSGIVFAPYDGLVDACRSLLASGQEQRARAEQARRFGAQLDFAGPFDSVLKALAQQLAVPRQPPRPPPPQPIGAPQPIAAPQPVTAPRPAPAGAAAHDQAPLSTEEIEAILEREASELPPEANLQPRPVAMVQREPGQHRFSRWVIWLIILFTLASLIQALR